MKNLFLIAFFCSMVFTTFSQSNLTWTVKGDIPQGYLKRSTVFNSNFNGFKNNVESAAFIQKLKSNSEIESCDVVSSTENSCDVKITMKRIHEKSYYLNFASSVGVNFISINGDKKSLDEIKQESTK